MSTITELQASPIEVETGNAIGIIRINRPQRFNAMDVETARDFRKAGLRLARDSAVRAVIIEGSNGIFCSGADLKYVRDRGSEQDFAYLRPDGTGAPPGYGESFKEILEYLHSAISEFKRANKPFIAAVDGMAAAGGFGIAMACDLVYASERATFEWAYGKTALTGAESSTFFLPRLVGLRKALELALRNPRLDAAAALQLGLINDVFPTNGFVERVRDIAREIAAGPLQAFGITKSLLHRAAAAEQLDFHLDQELESLVRSADGPEFAEGLAAFLEKRPAKFF